MKKLLLLLLGLTLSVGTFAACFSDDNDDSVSVGTESVQPQEIYHKVTFKQEGYDDIVITVKDGEALPEIPAPKSKTGYTIVWLTYDFDKITADMTVTAIATPNDSVITFDADGGEVSESTKTVTYDAAYTLPVPTKAGHTFKGWKFQGDILPTSGTWSNVWAELTLKAVWEPKTYTITFNMNADDPFLAIKPMTVAYGHAFELSDPHRIGYTFVAWKDEQNEVFTDDEVWSLTRDVELTAEWSANEYDVTLTVGEGTLDDKEHTFTYGAAYELPTPVRAGYDFIRWTGADGEGEVPMSGIWNIAKDITLKAMWQEKADIQIRFEQFGQPTVIKTVKEGETLTDIPEIVPVEGYIVVWEDADYTNLTEDLTVKSEQTPKNYTVNLEADSGTLSQNTLSTTYDSAYTLPTPNKNGYKFDGWMNGTEKVANSGTWKIDDDDLTLTAAWKAKEYTVRFNADGGSLPSATTETKTVTFGQEYSLPVPTKTGYKFKGWFGTKAIPAVGTWDVYDIADGEEYTLTASWEVKKFTVTYDLDGGTGISDDTFSNVTYDNEYTLTSKIPTKSGYVFKGWSYNGKTVAAKGDKWNIDAETGTIALKAVWEKVTEPDPDGGVWTPNY